MYFRDALNNALEVPNYEVDFSTRLGGVRNQVHIITMLLLHKYGREDTHADVCKFLSELATIALHCNIEMFEYEQTKQLFNKVKSHLRTKRKKVLLQEVHELFNRGTGPSREVLKHYLDLNPVPNRLLRRPLLTRLFNEIKNYLSQHGVEVEVFELGGMATGRDYLHDADIGIVVSGQYGDPIPATLDKAYWVLKEFAKAHHGTLERFETHLWATVEGAQGGNSGLWKFKGMISFEGYDVKLDMPVGRVDSRGAMEVHWASGKEVVAALAEKAKSLGYRLMPCGLFPGNGPGEANFRKAVVTKSDKDVYHILRVPYMDPTKRNSTISQEVGVDYRGQLVAHDQLCKWGHRAREEGDSEDVSDYDSE